MERGTLLYVVIVAGLLVRASFRAAVDKRPAWRRVFDGAARLEVALISILLGSLIFFGCLQIFLRNAFHTGLLWADPLMRHIVLWLGCLGGVMATARVRHISIDILSRFLPSWMQAARDRLIHLATAVAASVLGMASLRLVIDEREFGESAFLGIDIWQLQVILPVAFFLIAYRSFLNMFLARKPKPLDWEDVAHGG